MSKLSAEQKDEIVQAYNTGNSILKLAKNYNVSTSSIWELLKKRGISCRSQSISHMGNSIYQADWDYFKNIASLQVNGWAGFIAADGYISEKSRRLEIEIHPKDESIMQAFLQDIKSNHKVISGKRGRNSLFVGICSDKIISDLKYWNIIQNKSLILEPPSHLGLSEAMAWIKGYFIDDGTLYFVRCPKIEIIGTANVLTWICATINNYCKLKKDSGSICSIGKGSCQSRLRYQDNFSTSQILKAFQAIPTFSLKRKTFTTFTDSVGDVVLNVEDVADVRKRPG